MSPLMQVNYSMLQNITDFIVYKSSLNYNLSCTITFSITVIYVYEMLYVMKEFLNLNVRLNNYII